MLPILAVSIVRFIILLQLMTVTRLIQMLPICGLVPQFALFLESENFKKRSSASFNKATLTRSFKDVEL